MVFYFVQSAFARPIFDSVLENRLRQFSHPLKVFRYFASVEKGGNAWMTPSDFLVSLLPYQEQPSPTPFTPVRLFLHRLGHEIDGDWQEEKERRRTVINEVTDFFKMADVDGDGLINFTEYCFFLTLLATPTHHIDMVNPTYYYRCTLQ